MNQKNYDFLKDGLKYLGFGEGLNKKLEEGVASGKPEFQLNTVNEYGRDKVSYSLDFKKSDQSDMYFFNKYQASFKPEGDTAEKSQTFYIHKNSGITAKEAYNLLDGRSVNKDLTNKEGQPYNAWIQIDWEQKTDRGEHKFKMIHQGYGFDLDKELSKHPIKELDLPVSKERLMQSLERGNLHQVSFVKADREDKMFIEASPQYKGINVYDANHKKVYQSDKQESKVNEVAPVKEVQKQKEPTVKNEDPPAKVKKEPKSKLKM